MRFAMSIAFEFVVLIFLLPVVTSDRVSDSTADRTRLVNLHSSQFAIFEHCPALPVCMLFPSEIDRKNCLLFCCALCQVKVDEEDVIGCESRLTNLQETVNTLNVHRLNDEDKLHLEWNPDKGGAMCYIGSSNLRYLKPMERTDRKCVDSDNFKLDLTDVKYHCDEEVETKMGCACYCNSVLPGSIYTNGRCDWNLDKKCTTSVECRDVCRLSKIEDFIRPTCNQCGRCICQPSISNLCALSKFKLEQLSERRGRL